MSNKSFLTNGRKLCITARSRFGLRLSQAPELGSGEATSKIRRVAAPFYGNVTAVRSRIERVIKED